MTLLERRSPVKILAGVILAGSAAFVLATRYDTIMAGQIAFPITLAATIVAGLLLLVTGLRRVRRRRSASRVAGAVAGLVLAVIVAGSLLYLRPVPATGQAGLAAPDGGVTVTDRADRIELSGPAPSGKRLVFYPGARIDPRAYVRILGPIAQAGTEVRIVKEPFNLAFLAPGAAAAGLKGVAAGKGFVAGHSLGGVVAAAAVARTDAGLILWASYPAASIAGSGRAVASVYGSADGLTTPADVGASRANLPNGTTFRLIEGATHGSFGDFAPLSGDGKEGAKHQELQAQISGATAAFIAAR